MSNEYEIQQLCSVNRPFFKGASRVLINYITTMKTTFYLSSDY